MTRRTRRRSGFSLIELLIVVVIVGILAGVALPSLMQAIYRADASKVASDARTVNLAVRTYMEDEGALPPGGGWGVIPKKLQPYLPEALDFSYKSLDYRLVVQKKKGTARLEVRYANKDPVGVALQFLRSPSVTWAKGKTTFWFEG